MLFAITNSRIIWKQIPYQQKELAFHELIQAITWTNHDSLGIGIPGTIHIEILIKIQKKKKFPENTLENLMCSMSATLSRHHSVNSSPHSFAYMHQWIGSAPVQIMTCHLFGAKPLFKPIQCWVIALWTLRNKLQLNYNQYTKLFINENTSENIVCKMAAILSQPQWVNWGWTNLLIHGCEVMYTDGQYSLSSLQKNVIKNHFLPSGKTCGQRYLWLIKD